MSWPPTRPKPSGGDPPLRRRKRRTRSPISSPRRTPSLPTPPRRRRIPSTGSPSPTASRRRPSRKGTGRTRRRTWRNRTARPPRGRTRPAASAPAASRGPRRRRPPSRLRPSLRPGPIPPGRRWSSGCWSSPSTTRPSNDPSGWSGRRPSAGWEGSICRRPSCRDRKGRSRRWRSGRAITRTGSVTEPACARKERASRSGSRRSPRRGCRSSSNRSSWSRSSAASSTSSTRTRTEGDGLRAAATAAVLILTVLAGCGGSQPRLDTLPTQEGDWIEARRNYEKGDPLRAIERLSEFIDTHPGSNHLDEALLLLGKARQKVGDNLVAVEDFNRLIRDFPQSPHREEAEYLRGVSHFNEILGPAKDPRATETALNLLQAYLLRYPEGSYVDEAQGQVEECRERLARKAFLNGKTYEKLDQDRAATIYYEKALETKSTFEGADEALYRLAHAYQRLEEPEEARRTWERLIEWTSPARLEEDEDLRRMRAEAMQALARLPDPVPDAGENGR
ncbi:MAG: outer membrane protein assembly factor BamD [Candidatus Eisenbacteria bacterium]|nr:outer membrane protein assembly factor BamD [Candidatus Latescibacterota bacterium]MBD3303173.1 outer membrane protein assembly factor BamD [Candidatus Eisenbacteria bacterium]